MQSRYFGVAIEMSAWIYSKAGKILGEINVIQIQI